MDQYSVSKFTWTKQKEYSKAVCEGSYSEKQGESSNSPRQDWEISQKQQERRWTDYCLELYNRESFGNNQYWTTVSHQKKLFRKKVMTAVAALKWGGGMLLE